MKYNLIVLLSMVSLLCSAQTTHTVLKTINDDGKNMQVKLNIMASDLSFNYDRTFDVAHMNAAQKKVLVDRIIDTLGVRKYYYSEVSQSAVNSADKEQVTAAVRDYVEAVYEADTSKIERSVSKKMVKRGYYSSNGTLHEATMTYDELMRLTKRWKNGNEINESTPKKITVLDVLNHTASAKLEAKWGIDYFHLAKINGRWMIMNVLWQEHPTKN